MIWGGSTETYDYDHAGNRSYWSSTGWTEALTYGYDYQQHLVQVNGSAGTDPFPHATYTYDALGRRIGKGYWFNFTSHSYDVEKRFYYAGAALILETDHSGTSGTIGDEIKEVEYFWGQGLSEPVQERKYDLVTETLEVKGYYHQNLTASVYGITDSAHSPPQLVETYRYSDYGEAVCYGGDTTQPTTPLGNRFMWHCRYQDLEIHDLNTDSKLYHGPRGYDPETGGYLSRNPSDPAGVARGGPHSTSSPLDRGQTPTNPSVTPSNELPSRPPPPNRGGASGKPPPMQHYDPTDSCNSSSTPNLLCSADWSAIAGIGFSKSELGSSLGGGGTPPPMTIDFWGGLPMDRLPDWRPLPASLWKLIKIILACASDDRTTKKYLDAMIALGHYMTNAQLRCLMAWLEGDADFPFLSAAQEAFLAEYLDWWDAMHPVEGTPLWYNLVQAGLFVAGIAPGFGGIFTVVSIGLSVGMGEMTPEMAAVAVGTMAVLGSLGGAVSAMAGGCGDDAASAVVRSSSRQLGNALEEAGHVRPPGSAAHHIVAGEAKRAAEARQVLEKFGIGINDASNGVFLPPSIHNPMHSHAYYDAVTKALNQVTTKEEAIEALGAIRQGVLRGSFP